MNQDTTELTDYDHIVRTIQHYIDGARSGSGDVMRPAFHRDAVIFGYVGPELHAGPIEQLFAWNDRNGPAEHLDAHIASADITGDIATVRLELDNWTGRRFTDLFSMIRIDGTWLIVSKVFHLHA